LGIAASLVASFFLFQSTVFASPTTSLHAGSDGPTTNAKQKHPWCGVDGKPDCPAPDPGWISVTDNTPGAAARAIVGSGMFASIKTTHGIHALDLPARVHTLATPSGYDYYDDDHWVVSVRDKANKQVGIFDFVYDSANQRVRFASYGILRPGDTRYGHAFPTTQPTAVLQRLQTERGLSAKAGAQADLVFFPPDQQRFGAQAKQPWGAGGSSPLDAIWQVPGANGVNYYVGSDQHVYELKDLPIGSGR
jgi:hypothetical protein